MSIQGAGGPPPSPIKSVQRGKLTISGTGTDFTAPNGSTRHYVETDATLAAVDVAKTEVECQTHWVEGDRDHAQHGGSTAPIRVELYLHSANKLRGRIEFASSISSNMSFSVRYEVIEYV